LLIALLLALALALVGCGDDGGGAKEGAPAEETQESETAPKPADLTDTKVKPQIEKPAGSSPRRLQKEDIVKGRGRGAKSGDQVTVQYVGVSFSTGEEFDASWDRGEPFAFQLGQGNVIPGWDKGIVGMKKGGRRKLVIPPEQAYGAEGSPPAIGPNETLIFVVDLVKVG
jgi:peptidylprolyl isomerase